MKMSALEKKQLNYLQAHLVVQNTHVACYSMEQHILKYLKEIGLLNLNERNILGMFHKGKSFQKAVHALLDSKNHFMLIILLSTRCACAQEKPCVD